MLKRVDLCSGVLGIRWLPWLQSLLVVMRMMDNVMAGAVGSVYEYVERNKVEDPWFKCVDLECVTAKHFLNHV